VVTGLLLLWDALQTSARPPHAGACGEMAIYTVSLGVDYGYCHAPSGWTGTEKPPMRTALAVSPDHQPGARQSSF